MVKHTAGRPLSQVNTGVAKATYDLTRLLTSQAQTAHAHGATSADHTPAVGNMVGTPSAKICKKVDVSPHYSSTSYQDIIPTRYPNNPDTSESLHYLHNSSLRCDVELARIAMGLCLSSQFRIWLVLHQLSRDTGWQGFTFDELYGSIGQLGVQGCPAYISRLLRNGAGRFWRIDARGTIFPVGYITLCKRLVITASDQGLNYLCDHQPGTRRPMYLDISGSMKSFEAHILAAWYECHNNPTVSRFLLQRWFNRSDVTLRKLERRARVQKTYNTAETLEPSALPLNAKGELRFHRQRKNRRGQTVYSFQLPNTYHVKGVKQHAYRGQGRKAAAVVRQLTDQLTDLCSVGDEIYLVPGEDNRRGRLYYADYKRVRQARRKGRAGVVYSPSRPGGVRHTVWDVWV